MKNKYEKLTNEEILSEMKKMNQTLSSRKELKKVKEVQTKSINNITTKDFVVYWGSYGDRDRNDQPEYSFSFTIRHGIPGKEYDIYYECGDPLHSWWPIVGEEGDDNCDRNGAFEFIPPGFVEACENSYEYRGTVEEAVKKLKEYGFVNFQRSDYDDDVDELKAPDGL